MQAELFRNRTAIVTGGARGIGLACAAKITDGGGRVALWDRDMDRAKQSAASLRDAIAVEVDVTSETSCRALIDKAAARHGRLDILVNNAGINIRKPPDTLSAAEWHTVIDTNLTSAFICTHAAYPHMKKTGRGKIINIGSMMSIFGAGFAPAYAASKGGIVQLTRACATAWAKENIQVNAVLPGWIDTDLTRDARREVAGLHESVLARTPAGRWGDPKDFAGIAVFLASAASDFVTGAAIPVDGGYSVQG